MASTAILPTPSHIKIVSTIVVPPRRFPMGKSYVSKRDVYETFIEKLPATIMLTVSSVLLTMLIAIQFGILSAVKHNKWIDYLIRFFSFIGNSMPNFFAALVLMYFFSIRLGWLRPHSLYSVLQGLSLLPDGYILMPWRLPASA